MTAMESGLKYQECRNGMGTATQAGTAKGEATAQAEDE